MGLVEKAIADYRKALELDPALEIAEINLLSLFRDAVSAGFNGRHLTRPAGRGQNAKPVEPEQK